MQSSTGTLVVRELSKSFGEARVVSDASLAVRQGEFFSLLGPSGCGKTTLLRMIAGFVEPTSGQIELDGRSLLGVPPEHRGMGMVFQNYAIFPHLTVFENVAFGLRMRHVPKDEIARRVGATLAQVGLTGYERRHEHQLSGGERQRVALARVLVLGMRVLLLDEPLSALDRKLREEMKQWLRRIQQETGVTVVYVTHDQSEALEMSTRVAVMRASRILQVGPPAEVYERPRSVFVATFVGQANLLPVTIEPAGDAVAALLANGTRVAIPRAVEVPAAGLGTLLVRPERIAVGAPDGDGVSLIGTVRTLTYHGPAVFYEVEVAPQGTVTVQQANNGGAALRPGDRVGLSWPAGAAVLLPREDGAAR